MTTNEIRQIIESAVANKQMVPYWYFLAQLIIAGGAAYFGAYFYVKGKNLADKEDIGRITKETQAAMKPYTEQLVMFTKEIERRNALEEKGAENAFVLSATSHMAQVAFDKHMEFCERYLSKVREGLSILVQEGPTAKASEIANGLWQVRQDFVLWETKDVALLLNRFDGALREIAFGTLMADQLPVGEKRSERLDKTFDVFDKVLHLQPLPDGATDEVAIAHIIASLRDHLGVSQLTELRKHYLAEAAKRIESR
jgi:hypothetical protein